MVVISPLSEGPSSSSSTHYHRYDVFLSFRGLDTRLTFTDHLHKALINANITTFLDEEEVETGQDLKPELRNAIKASRASIIVLSKNYAFSTWCLDELVIILEQHENSNYIVIPIFYHVKPTDVRNQQSSFRDAMTKHKERMEAETDVEEKCQLCHKIEIWKKTLTKVSNLKGQSAEGRKETKFIEEIVRDIYHRLRVPLRTNLPPLFGMEKSIYSISLWLNDRSVHNADILTIFGIGGIGKTSLARYVHELHCRSFDRSSFIEGVNKKCAEQVNGLLDLQKQLCSDISKPCLVQIHDVFKYTPVVENALACQKVFVVLDDVDTLEQLDALLGNKGFHPGSKIIITTKDVSLTETYTAINLMVQPKHTKLFLEGLGEQASLQLLSYHAFKGNPPKDGYEEVSEKLMAYCQGHPLALKVLSESLHKRDVVEWQECIEGLKEEPNSRVQKALQMSFDSMPSNNDKELFKHIACFFVGKDRNYTETILKACGIRTLQGMKNLIDRCLLMIGQWNELKMHQLVQDMGREAVRQESPDKPWKRSRLWCHEESFNVLEQNKGSGKLKGLILDMEILVKEHMCEWMDLKTDSLSKMDNLMLLQLNYVQLGGSYKTFPKKLRWLCMHGSPLKSIPLDWKLENLVDLDMSYSNLESFDMSYSHLQRLQKREKLIIGSFSKKDNQLLRSLKILNLSFCKQLHTVGGFIKLPALERLILANCIGLIEVCESIGQCDELVHIDLSYCNKLKNLPRNMVKLKKVEILVLNGNYFSEFPVDTRLNDLPKVLKDNNIGINSQTSSSVIDLSRDYRSFFISLPSSLVRLSLKDNNLSNESFPMDFNCLSMLQCLYLDHNPIVSLPNCVRSLRKLKLLSMVECKNLKTIMHPPCTVTTLWLRDMENLQKIGFGQETSPLMLKPHEHSFRHSSFEIEGIVKIQPMADVTEEVLRSLGWTNLEFIKTQQTTTTIIMKGRKKTQVQMYYEFGIFSTFYVGKEVPNWISHRREGSSISLIIPSSPSKLRGINFCYVRTLDVPHSDLPLIRISNKTKNRTWIYCHYIESVDAAEKCVTSLSHWMFGKNEMEDGDQITITVLKRVITSDLRDLRISECGVSFVYDDGKNKMEEEEDVLSYYKSWNYIIGGDPSIFLSSRREYVLNIGRFFWDQSHNRVAYCLPYVGDDAYYKYRANGLWFRAFSQRKSNVVGGAAAEERTEHNVVQYDYEDESEVEYEDPADECIDTNFRSAADSVLQRFLDKIQNRHARARPRPRP